MSAASSSPRRVPSVSAVSVSALGVRVQLDTGEGFLLGGAASLSTVPPYVLADGSGNVYPVPAELLPELLPHFPKADPLEALPELATITAAAGVLTLTTSAGEVFTVSREVNPRAFLLPATPERPGVMVLDWRTENAPAYRIPAELLPELLPYFPERTP